MSNVFSKKDMASARLHIKSISLLSLGHYLVRLSDGKTLRYTRAQLSMIQLDQLKSVQDLRVGHTLRFLRGQVTHLEVAAHNMEGVIYAGRQSEGQQISPPSLGEKILLLILPKKDRECMLGDLAEEYAAYRAKYGTRFAKVWYYKQVIGSAWPMLKRAFRWGVIAWIGDWVRRHI